MDNKYDIFISYSRRDSELVLTVVKQLQKRGFTIWIDKDGIESGDAFKSVIVRAIKNSDVFLFFSVYLTFRIYTTLLLAIPDILSVAILFV